MVLKRGNPGCPCCEECQCIIDYGFLGGIQDAGTWTIIGTGTIKTASTSDSDARIRFPTAIPGWKIGNVRISPYARGEWYEVGFTDADYDNRVYVKWRINSSPSQLEIEWRETVGGVDSLISSQTITVGSSGVPAVNWCIFFHDDLGIVSARATGTFGDTSVMRSAFTFETAAPYFYIATGTIGGTITADNAGTKVCYSRTELVDDEFYQTQKAPAEWEIDLSGVAQGEELVTCLDLGGDPFAYGYHDFWDEFNAVHVAQFSHFAWEGLNKHYWQSSDEFTWSDPSVLSCFGVATSPVVVAWKLRALYISKADAADIQSSLVGISPYLTPCGGDCDCQRINPAYDEQPVLVLVVQVTYEATDRFSQCKVTWAAVLESDWDCASYYDECQQTPILLPANCAFDWRTLQDQELTFLCAEGDAASGIDWSNSTLKVTAIP